MSSGGPSPWKQIWQPERASRRTLNEGMRQDFIAGPFPFVRVTRGIARAGADASVGAARIDPHARGVVTHASTPSPPGATPASPPRGRTRPATSGADASADRGARTENRTLFSC